MGYTSQYLTRVLKLCYYLNRPYFFPKEISMNDKKLLILVDYRHTFYSSTREVAGSMDVEKVRKLFSEEGFEVEVKGFSEVDFAHEEYTNSFVLYQSSEDPDLRYKDFIEDVLLGLELNRAILIPGFKYFRAHHNKVFMEILRDLSGLSAIQNIHSRRFGTVEELRRHVEDIPLPSVIKPGAGSRSRGVGLAHSVGRMIRSARSASRSFSLMNLQRAIMGFINRIGYKPISNFRNKFIVQEFIEGLSCDYKILVYSDKYYVLRRMNRRDDFRASGSGRLSFPRDLPDGLLDYVESVFDFFNVPFGSFDIAVRQGQFFLLEFQFLSFGQYALEKSSFFFRKDMRGWKLVESTSDLERTFVTSVCAYIDKHHL